MDLGAADADDADVAAIDAIVTAARAKGDGACARLEVDVDGVSCASCAWLVEKVAAKQGGVLQATLNPARGTLGLVVDDVFAAAPLASALRAAGHRVRPSDGRRHNSGDVDGLVFRLGTSAMLAMTSMISSFSLFFGLKPTEAYGELFSTLAAVSALGAVVVGGGPFFRGAWASLRAGAATMDLPIAVGMVAALGANMLAAKSGAVVSFDSVAIFATLMVAGRLIERRLVLRHRLALRQSDAEVSGLKVRRIDADGQLRFVQVKDVVAGDRLHLANGELNPTDGVVEGDGPRAVSLAWLTGESTPELIAPGATLMAGAHVRDARGLALTATAPFSSSRLSTLLGAAHKAGAGDDDRPVATAFFPWLAKAWVAGSFAVAAIGALVWRHAEASQMLSVVASLLVVTCPCAFGIAAPLAVERATVLLRQRGVFVRHPRLWWRAMGVKHAIFDKTGTITEEEPALSSSSSSSLLALPTSAKAALLAVAQRSNHARSRAIASALVRDGVVADVAADVGRVIVDETAGVGLRGVVGDVIVDITRDDVDAGATVVAIAGPGVDTRVVLAFDEVVRRGAVAAIAALKAQGIEVWIASGDGEDRTHAIAKSVGVDDDDVFGACSPEDKAALVARLGVGATLVVGDGVNDAAMFAAAAVSGVPASDRAHLPAHTDFLLLGSVKGGAFGSVAEIVTMAKVLRRSIALLLSLATVYNVAVVSAGIAGLLSPLLVAVLMPAMSVSLLMVALWSVGQGAATDDRPSITFQPSLSEVSV